MKRFYLLLGSLLMLVTASSQAQITGPGTVCHGQTATYTVTNNSCFVQIDGSDRLDHGTFSYGATPNTFTIAWTNTTLANISDEFDIYISGDWVNGCQAYYVYTLNVTIRPGTTFVNTPSTPTLTFVSGRLYQFSTSSSNATSYEWVVTGGAIQGSATGGTINVLRNSGSCTFSAKARGSAAGCAGTIYSSYSSTTSYTVPTPPLGGITGTTYLYPYASVTYTPYFTATNVEQGSVSSWTLSDPGGRLSWYSVGNTAYVSNGSPSSTLYFATLTCTVSNGCGTQTASQSLMYGGVSGMSARINQTSPGDVRQSIESTKIFPNPASQGDAITIEFPAGAEADEYAVYDRRGQMVSKQKITDEPKDLPLSQLRAGLYVVHVLRKGKTIERKKLIVE
jgi:hypothetical protein